MERAARLLAIEEIKRLKAKYFLGADSKDWALLRGEVLSPDVRFDLPEYRPEPLVGIEEVMDLIRLGLEGLGSVHHGHMPVIEITGETSATGIWAMEDRLYHPPGGPLVIHGFGHYYETYEKRAEGWRIATIRLTRLRVERRTIA